jgi:uncharacterized protein (TIGR02145 family)
MKKTFLFYSLLLVLFSNCNKVKPGEITINNVDFITHNTARISCTIINEDESSETGFSYTEFHNPTIDDNNTKNIYAETGQNINEKFYGAITNLKPNTTYYVRAYAKNSGGINYSNEVEIKTADAEILTDSRDGQTYYATQIGTLTWMTENLNYNAESSVFYDNNSINGEIHGKLYNFETANNSCPQGWHLPSDDEWKQLEYEIGMSTISVDTIGERGANFYYKLLEIGKDKWQTNCSINTNEYGFTALPSGFYDATDTYFTGQGVRAYFWTSTYSSSDSIWYRVIGGTNYITRHYRTNDNNCLSVRCVKD